MQLTPFRFGLILICSFLFCIIASAQSDSVKVAPKNTLTKGVQGVNQPVISSPDTLKKTIKPEPTASDTARKKHVHSPAKAAIMSAILPGLGQIYNRKYWKVGILAAGTAGLIYSLNFSNRNYTLYKSELIARQQGASNLNEGLAKYTNGNLNELQDFYRRNRDLSVIGLALLYAINVIDATVDGHLFDFNVNDNLSMRLKPEPVYAFDRVRPSPGLRLSFTF